MRTATRPRRAEPRSHTIQRKHLTRELLATQASLLDVDSLDAVAERPRTRGDCQGQQRPCPWVGCRHNLVLDVTESGGIKRNFPHLEIEEHKDTCALDVADRGGLTLEEVGVAVNLTRERVRQIEVRALITLRRRSAP